MKFLNMALVGMTLAVSCLTNVANAGPITTNPANLDNLMADYSQAATGNFSGLTGGKNNATFNGADFGALNGTATTTNASRDSATFKLSVDNLLGFTGNSDFQYLFESGGQGDGIGLYYTADNQMVFSQRTKSVINTVSLDVTSLIGESFDIVASLSLDDNVMRIFIGENMFAEQELLDGSVDWSGGNGGAFGKANSSLVSGNNTGRNFNSGDLSGFAYYHDVVVDVPEPTTLAIFALGIMGLAARRFKK